MGNQYHTWSVAASRFTQQKVPSYRERHTSNVIDPVVRTWTAQLLRSNPEMDVMPGGTDSKARRKSRLNKKLLQWHQIECQWAYTQQLVANWMWETGSGFINVAHDPSVGPLQEAVDLQGNILKWEGTDEPMIDELGNPLTYQPGGVDWEVVPPFQILIDPQYLGHIDGSPYITRRTVKTVDWVRQNFPEKGKYIQGNLDLSDDLWLERQFTAISQGSSSGSLDYGGSDSTTRWVIYYETWVRPTAEYPRGRLICSAENMILRMTDSPYLEARGARPDRDWHPFVHFCCIPIGGRFWPQDIVGNLTGIQRAINLIVSICLEHVKLLGKPKWMIPEGSMAKGRKITSEPGEQIRYNAAYGEPHVSIPTPLSGDIFKLLEVMFQHLDFVSAQHGPSRGQAPQGVKSGVGVNLLQEQDEMDLSPISSLWEDSLAKLGRKTLLRVSQFWDAPRLIQIAGPNNELDAFRFSGADVSSSSDVVVRAGSALPKSRIATMARIKDLVNIGYYQPALVPAHRREIAIQLELGSAEERMEGDRIDQRRAQMENEWMAMGLNPAVEWYQNHDIHLEEHVLWMKSDEFQRLVAQKPDLYALMNFHIVAHTQPAQQMAMQQMQGLPGQMMPGQMGGPMGSAPMDGNPSGNLSGLPGMPGLSQAQSNSEQNPQTGGSNDSGQ